MAAWGVKVVGSEGTTRGICRSCENPTQFATAGCEESFNSWDNMWLSVGKLIVAQQEKLHINCHNSNASIVSGLTKFVRENLVLSIKLQQGFVWVSGI